MTPLHLEILLHYFYSPEPFKFKLEASEYCLDLFKQGLLDSFKHTSSDPIKITAKGKAHVRQLLNLELPKSVCAFVGADGKLITEDF